MPVTPAREMQAVILVAATRMAEAVMTGTHRLLDIPVDRVDNRPPKIEFTNAASAAFFYACRTAMAVCAARNACSVVAQSRQPSVMLTPYSRSSRFAGTFWLPALRLLSIITE